MIIDSRLQLAAALNIPTSATGAQVFGDYIDLGTVPRDIGAADDLYLLVQVTTSFAGPTSCSFSILNDNSGPPAFTTPNVVASSPALATAVLAAGRTVWCIELPRYVDMKRYLGVGVTINGAAATAGAVNVFITTEPGRARAYPDALPPV